MYLYELAHWLATVVDSLVVKDQYKDEAYRAATVYIADCLMVRALHLQCNRVDTNDDDVGRTLLLVRASQC